MTVYIFVRGMRSVLMNNKQEDKLEIEINKLISDVQELQEISDMYVAYIKQRILNSYCEN